MPDNVEIKLTSTADLKGFDQAKRAADDLGKATAAAGAAGSQGIKPLEDRVQSATEKKKAWTDAIRGVALEFPVLARFGMAAISPISAAVGAAISGFAALRSALQNVQDAVSVSEKFEDLSDAMVAQKAALDDLVTSSAAYDRSLAAVARSTDTVTQKTSEAIDALRQKSRLETELSNAEEAAALSQIDAQEKLGTLSGPQAIAARLEVQRRFAGQRQDIEARQAAETQRLRQAERGALRAEASTLDEAIAAQEGRLAGITSPAEFDARLRIAERNRAAAKKQAEARDKAADKFGVGALGAVAGIFTGGDGLGIERAQETDSALEEQLDSLVGSLQGGRAGAIVEFQAAQEELARLRARRTAVAQRQNAVGSELEGSVRESILGDQFRPRITAAQQRAREAGPLAELAASGPTSPAGEFQGTGPADSAVRSIDAMGGATVEALRAIAASAAGWERSIAEIREQLRNNRPPQ